ncbi:MAG: sigma-E processing peptidase SpoIIGA [Clostridiales bacterium]|nr:sigma-E processing peptidase SpoIIGA [Clostridiales bacterium]
MDILFILHFFITYLLLLTAMKLLKSEEKRWRLLLGAFLGGAYSLIILVNGMPFWASTLLKLVSSAVIVLAAFGFHHYKRFLRAVAFFFGANFIFVGVMIALWFTLRPNALLVNNSTVYFDISARTLILSALAAYALASLIIKIHNRTAAKHQLYHITVHSLGKEASFTAFVDSGNKLREPFSNTPVIVADRGRMEGLYHAERMRIIPYHTVGGSGMLEAFKPDMVLVDTGSGAREIKDVYIALSEDRFQNGDFKGLINPDLLNI